MAFSPEQNHIAVNYHYVEDPRDDTRGIHPCRVAEFERQIAFLSSRYSFASIPEVFEAAQKDSQDKLCAITFDDGLRDQWENAVPVLKKYKVLATFFIITATLEGIMPSAHKIHLLSSRFSMQVLVERFNAFLSNVFPEHVESYRIPLDRYLNNKRRHDQIAAANLKEMLNNIIPSEISRAFLSEIYKEIGVKEKDMCRKIFMTSEEIHALQRMGFFVETHTHYHRSLDKETNGVLADDFRAATDTLHRILGRSPRVIAYPYGRAPKDDRMLGTYGISHGVTVESRAIVSGDNPLLIPRFDTNDIRNFLNTITVNG